MKHLLRTLFNVFTFIITIILSLNYYSSFQLYALGDQCCLPSFLGSYQSEFLNYKKGKEFLNEIKKIDLSDEISLYQKSELKSQEFLKFLTSINSNGENDTSEIIEGPFSFAIQNENLKNSEEKNRELIQKMGDIKFIENINHHQLQKDLIISLFKTIKSLFTEITINPSNLFHVFLIKTPSDLWLLFQAFECPKTLGRLTLSTCDGRIGNFDSHQNSDLNLPFIYYQKRNILVSLKEEKIWRLNTFSKDLHFLLYDPSLVSGLSAIEVIDQKEKMSENNLAGIIPGPLMQSWKRIDNNYLKSFLIYNSVNPNLLGNVLAIIHYFPEYDHNLQVLPPPSQISQPLIMAPIDEKRIPQNAPTYIKKPKLNKIKSKKIVKEVQPVKKSIEESE